MCNFYQNMKLRLICLCLFSFTDICFGESRILTAPSDTSPEEFPHQAAVFGGEWFCSAILITKDYVLAPAKCLKKRSTIKVFLGFQRYPYYASNHNEKNTQIFDSDEVIFHEGFHEVTPYHHINDIALVKLPESATLSSRIQPGILMSKEETHFLEEEYATVSGWMVDLDLNMQFQTVKILNQDQCGLIFGEQFLKYQEICIKSASLTTVNLHGNNLKVNGKILGFIDTPYSPCHLLTDNCEKYNVVRKVSPYLNWIAEKINVPITNLTGSYTDVAANINGKVRDVLNELDKTKEEIRVLRAELENNKNETKIH